MQSQVNYIIITGQKSTACVDSLWSRGVLYTHKSIDVIDILGSIMNEWMNEWMNVRIYIALTEASLLQLALHFYPIVNKWAGHIALIVHVRLWWKHFFI